jgi:hypothetical protein
VCETVHLVRLPLFGLLYQSRMMNDDEYGAVGGMFGKGNRSTRRKPARMPLCPPQIPHGPSRWESTTNLLSYGTVDETLLNLLWMS